jgi:hypothetical protein
MDTKLSIFVDSATAELVVLSGSGVERHEPEGYWVKAGGWGVIKVRSGGGIDDRRFGRQNFCASSKPDSSAVVWR